MSTIKNLADFVREHGGENPYYAGRCLYKYTDCGPWITYLVEEEAEHCRLLAFAIGMKDGKLSVVYQEEGYGKNDMATEKDLEMFGFKEGKCRCARTLKSFRAMAKAFYIKTKGHANGKQFVVHDCDYRTGTPDPKRVWITVSYTIPAMIREVYYEDKEANEMLANCVGIKMGSIVEGSEAYVDRDPLMFPFESDEFDDYLKGINDEASFYWKRDNLDSYQVDWRGKTYHIDAGWGEELKLPKTIKTAVENHIASLEEAHYEPVHLKGGITITQLDKSDFCY